MSLKPYTGRLNPYLSINSPPNSFYMDLMELSSYTVRKANFPMRAERRKIVPNLHSGGYSHILVIIEGTSRKLFAYPLKNKSAPTVYESFKNFLEDATYRVNSITSDSGGEYADIWKSKEAKEHKIKFYKVVAADGYHTPLAKVDRVIRTLRLMITNYFNKYKRIDWHKILPKIVEIYNTSKHQSLFAYKKSDGKREYFTPNQVWTSPILAKIVRNNDIEKGKKGNKYLEDKFVLDNKTEYKYIIDGDPFMKGSKKGMVSDDTVTLLARVGNSFQVCSDNKDIDGKLIPYQKLIPKRKTKGKLIKRARHLENFVPEDNKPNNPVSMKPSAYNELKRLTNGDKKVITKSWLRSGKNKPSKAGKGLFLKRRNKRGIQYIRIKL